MNITVIGGGTAGWLSALFFKKFGDHAITVIDSSRIGILGAGESSTPILPALLKNLDIDLNDFIKTTNATKKYANDFINWSPNGGEYTHAFELNYDKVVHGIHFDAKECAKYFKQIGINRDIKHLDINIINLNQNDVGDIISIDSEEGVTIETDFVIDCSGFARLGAGKLFNSKWISYSEHLKTNAALAYFLPQTENINQTTKTHTRSIAMKNGWMWQVPLQHRWGCGYVFNDRYISIEDAKKEVEEYIGKDIEVVKTFKYNPGSYEKTWNNNCVSLGLASGFLEPIEGTSLMTLIFSIFKLNKIGLGNYNNNEVVNEYNEYIKDINHQCMLFVRYHYDCERTDTDFWLDIKNSELPQELMNVKKNLYMMETNQDLLNIINPNSSFPIFGVYNYQMVNLGRKVKTKKTLV
jgi:tryptophan halogenase